MQGLGSEITFFFFFLVSQRLKLIDWLNRNRSQVVIASLESSAMASTAMLHAGLQSTPLTANSFSSSSFSSNSSNSVSGAPTALNCVPQFSNSIPSISLLSPFTAVTGAFGGREETLSQLQQLLAASGLTSETKPEIQAQILSIPNKPQGTTLKRSIRSLNTDFDVDSHMDGDAKKQKT